jgi:hypothetical protein
LNKESLSVVTGRIVLNLDISRNDDTKTIRMFLDVQSPDQDLLNQEENLREHISFSDQERSVVTYPR